MLVKSEISIEYFVIGDPLLNGAIQVITTVFVDIAVLGATGVWGT
jgi:hypothetical protein